MKRKYTRRNVASKISKQDNCLECQRFLTDSLSRHVASVEKKVEKVLDIKNDVIQKLTKELKECKAVLKNKDDLIKVLNNEKEVFNTIMYAEVQKFDGTYQSKIDNLEAENEELKKQILKWKYYETQQAEKTKTNSYEPSGKDNVKIRKLVKKCRDLKMKVKSREFDIFQKELEKKEVMKLVDAKDDTIEKGKKEISELTQKLNEEQKKLSIGSDTIDSMNKQGDLLSKEYRKLKLKSVENENLITAKSIAISDLELKLKEEQDRTFSLELLHNSKEDLEEELRKQEKRIEVMQVKINKGKELKEDLGKKEIEIEALKVKLTEKEEVLMKKETLIDEMSVKVNKGELLDEALAMKEKQIKDLKLEMSQKLKEELEKKAVEIEEIKDKLLKDKGTMDLVKEEYRNLKMKTDVNCELVRIKDKEILDKKFVEEEAKVSSLLTFKNQCKDLEEELNLTIKEVEELKQELAEEKAIQLSMEEDMKNLSEQNNERYKDLMRKQQESAKELLNRKDGEIVKLTDAKDQFKKKEHILMEIVKSKDLMIRILEENLAVLKMNNENESNKNAVQKVPENALAKQNISEQTKQLEKALASRNTSLNLL